MFSTGLIIINTHLKHLRGQDNLAKFSQSETIGSGNVMSNYFCKTCGSLMYRTSEVYEGISILRLGTVDDFSLADTALRPHIEQWTKHRVGWLDDVENVERSEDQFQPRNLNEGEL